MTDPPISRRYVWGLTGHYSGSHVRRRDGRRQHANCFCSPPSPLSPLPTCWPTLPVHCIPGTHTGDGWRWRLMAMGNNSPPRGQSGYTLIRSYYYICQLSGEQWTFSRMRQHNLAFSECIDHRPAKKLVNPATFRAKICPKSLDLYVSIYDSENCTSFRN